MNGLQPFESTIEQTAETMTPSHKTIMRWRQIELQAYESCYTTRAQYTAAKKYAPNNDTVNIENCQSFGPQSLQFHFFDTWNDCFFFYITCTRSILEYACAVFHRALSGYLSEDLERMQKRALRIIYPGMSYNQALEFSGLPTLFKRREEISSKLFNEVVGDPGHILDKLLPPKNPANYFLRRNQDFTSPLCKTDRCKKIFHF